jgi:HEPN domain-containing protein
MDKQVENRIACAQYDLKTAEHMSNTHRYIYTIFMCHLALEKLFKAKVQKNTKKTPPRTHNLRYLVEISKTTLPDQLLEFVSKLSDVSIVTRYPEDFTKLLKVYTKKVAHEYLKTTKKAFVWIRKSF